MKDYCKICFEDYSDKNPKYHEDYDLCCMCAAKITISVLSGTIVSAMVARGLQVE